MSKSTAYNICISISVCHLSNFIQYQHGSFDSPAPLQTATKGRSTKKK
ncbi:hypothetical protein UO65_3227 [Actinokineospora spheciospongiae]|uniref:Uncharacterized protein n=1 Tax=Actinokineospora spheciospongiae TaxID=909613 RepID=W7J5X8_9PSEU|nr:hypothetical protein UO65_3227 [Actinokineospora spheciospongiae]